MLALCMLLYGFVANAQITKGNWMVGGNAGFSATKYKSEASPNTNITIIKVEPDIGYFLLDKLAAGLKLGYNNTRNKLNGDMTYSVGKTITYNFGPFIRYYLLTPDNPFNILIDGSYQHGINRGKGFSSGGDPDWTRYTTNTFSVNGGPVLYFNSSVGLEFLIGYSIEKYKDHNGNNGAFHIGIGFQIHLEKDK